MNERNVAALRRELEAASTDKLGPVFQPSFYEAWAKALAARGVLVPASLTDEQAYGLGSGWQDGLPAAEVAPDVRAEMERIAKGEA